jgi:hypothetical protein
MLKFRKEDKLFDDAMFRKVVERGFNEVFFKSPKYRSQDVTCLHSQEKGLIVFRFENITPITFMVYPEEWRNEQVSIALRPDWSKGGRLLMMIHIENLILNAVRNLNCCTALSTVPDIDFSFQDMEKFKYEGKLPKIWMNMQSKYANEKLHQEVVKLGKQYNIFEVEFKDFTSGAEYVEELKKTQNAIREIFIIQSFNLE